VARGADPTRARGLAEQAEAAYGEAGHKHDEERKAVRDWLAARGGPRG
jgi:hypothetical protein